MKSAIEQLYKWENESDNIPVTEEWKKLADKAIEILDEFRPSLNDKQERQFIEILDCECGQHAEMIRQYYKEGFKLGLMLAVETMLK